jgi:hypothetical protein
VQFEVVIARQHALLQVLTTLLTPWVELEKYVQNARDHNDCKEPVVDDELKWLHHQNLLVVSG